MEQSSSRIRRAALAGLVATAVATAVPSNAGSVAGNGGATEITQILNNLQLLLQTIQEGESYYVQLKGLEEQLRNGISLDPSELADAASMALGSQVDINKTIGSARNLYGSLNEVNHLAEDRYRQFAASGLSWNKYIERETEIAARKKSARTMLSDREVAAIKRAQSNYSTYQRYASQIPATTEQQASLQLLSGQMNGMLVTLNSMMEMQATRNLAGDQEKIDDLAAREAAKEDAAKSMGAYQQSLERARQESLDWKNRSGKQ